MTAASAERVLPSASAARSSAATKPNGNVIVTGMRHIMRYHIDENARYVKGFSWKYPEQLSTTVHNDARDDAN